MNYVLDGIIIIVFLVFIIDGYKRGLMNAVIRIVCSLVSVAGSVIISSFGAVFIYNTFVKSHVVDSITAALPAVVIGDGASKNAAAVYDALPGFAENCLALLGISKKTFVDEYVSTPLAVPDMIENMIRPPLETLVMVICSVIFFMILSTIAYAATKAMSEAIDITNLRLTDRLFGAGLGLVQAALMMILMILLVNAMLVILPAANAAQLDDAVNNSIIYKPLHQLNIPVRIMSLFGVSG